MRPIAGRVVDHSLNLGGLGFAYWSDYNHGPGRPLHQRDALILINIRVLTAF